LRGEEGAEPGAVEGEEVDEARSLASGAARGAGVERSELKVMATGGREVVEAEEEEGEAEDEGDGAGGTRRWK